MHRNPLRYPGSKNILAPFVGGVIEAFKLAGCHLIEPFAGSAAVLQHCRLNGYALSGTLVEKDPLIFAFLKAARDEAEELEQLINKTEISLETWKNLQTLRRQYIVNDDNLLIMGFAGLFFNRTNYSGIIGAGPIGGQSQTSFYKIGCRFNKDVIISSIKSLSKALENVEIEHADGMTWIENNIENLRKRYCMIYIDPPYVEVGKKYYRDYMSEADHRRLAEILISCDMPWIASYDSSDLIFSLYSELFIYEFSWRHSARINKNGRELLISNRPLPKFENTPLRFRSSLNSIQSSRSALIHKDFGKYFTE